MASWFFVFQKCKQRDNFYDQGVLKRWADKHSNRLQFNLGELKGNRFHDRSSFLNSIKNPKPPLKVPKEGNHSLNHYNEK